MIHGESENHSPEVIETVQKFSIDPRAQKLVQNPNF